MHRERGFMSDRYQPVVYIVTCSISNTLFGYVQSARFWLTGVGDRVAQERMMPARTFRINRRRAPNQPDRSHANGTKKTFKTKVLFLIGCQLREVCFQIEVLVHWIRNNYEQC